MLFKNVKSVVTWSLMACSHCSLVEFFSCSEFFSTVHLYGIDKKKKLKKNQLWDLFIELSDILAVTVTNI